MDWIHPWIGLDWIGLDWVAIVKNVCGLDWIGSEAQKIIFEQLNCFIVLLSRSRLELLLTSQQSSVEL